MFLGAILASHPFSHLLYRPGMSVVLSFGIPSAPHCFVFYCQLSGQKYFNYQWEGFIALILGVFYNTYSHTVHTHIKHINPLNEDAPYKRGVARSFHGDNFVRSQEEFHIHFCSTITTQ